MNANEKGLEMKSCRIQSMLLIAAIAHAVQAYNVSGLVGAWVPAEDESRSALVVIEHHMAWVKDGASWRPCHLAESSSDIMRPGVALTPIEEGDGRSYVLEKPGAELLAKLAEAGMDATPDSVVLEERNDDAGCRKLNIVVRTEMPDWDKVVGIDSFVGTWTSAANAKMALIVRPGGSGAIVFLKKASSDDLADGTGCEIEWKRDCAGIRISAVESPLGTRRRIASIIETGVMALCPDGKSAVVAGTAGRPLVVVRNDTAVVDPAVFRRKMAEEASYHGMWVLPDRAKGYSFYISPKGRGILVSAEVGEDALLPFNWKAAGNGVVHCGIFPEFVKAGNCPYDKFSFLYHPIPNEIELMIPANAQDGGKAVSRPRLAFFNWGEMVDDVIEMAKKDLGRTNDVSAGTTKADQ